MNHTWKGARKAEPVTAPPAREFAQFHERYSIPVYALKQIDPAEVRSMLSGILGGPGERGATLAAGPLQHGERPKAIRIVLSRRAQAKWANRAMGIPRERTGYLPGEFSKAVGYLPAELARAKANGNGKTAADDICSRIRPAFEEIIRNANVFCEKLPRN